MGYGGSRKDAGQVVGRGGDEGIDGLIKEDRLGLDTVLVDGPMLAQLMMDAGVGVSETETIRILRADEDYFEGM